MVSADTVVRAEFLLLSVDESYDFPLASSSSSDTILVGRGMGTSYCWVSVGFCLFHGISVNTLRVGVFVTGQWG